MEVPSLKLLSASPLRLFPDVLVGTQADAWDVLLGANPLEIQAVVNCALDDWIFKMRPWRSEPAAAVERWQDLETSLRALPRNGDAFLGEVFGCRYCALPARDRDRAEAIIIDGEVAVKGLEAYDMGVHFPVACDFIQEQLDAGRRVLIHCLRGENRAGAVAAAFLVAKGKVAPEEAVQEVREVRGPYALSNRSFVEQVHAFAKHCAEGREKLGSAGGAASAAAMEKGAFAELLLC
eukprot:s2655_g2.t1